LSTISGILTRIGLGRLGRLGLEPAERYERAVAGELIDVDGRHRVVEKPWVRPRGTRIRRDPPVTARTGGEPHRAGGVAQTRGS
jgi:hypothetical protein